VAKNHIEHGITIFVRTRRIAAECIIDFSPVMFTARYLAVAVVIGLAPRVGKALDLVTLGIPHKTKIGICIATR